MVAHNSLPKIRKTVNSTSPEVRAPRLDPCQHFALDVVPRVELLPIAVVLQRSGDTWSHGEVSEPYLGSVGFQLRDPLGLPK